MPSMSGAEGRDRGESRVYSLYPLLLAISLVQSHYLDSSPGIHIVFIFFDIYIEQGQGKVVT